MRFKECYKYTPSHVNIKGLSVTCGNREICVARGERGPLVTCKGRRPVIHVKFGEAGAWGLVHRMYRFRGVLVTYKTWEVVCHR